MKWLLLGALCLQAAPASEIADAVMHRDVAAIHALLAAKPNVNEPQPDGTTALHWAARWDDLETARLLIRAGADAKIANHDGATPMFLAAQSGSVAMIAELLKAGVDLNAPVLSHGETALMMASRSGSVDAVKLLLDRGARIDAKDTLRGTTALMWAAEQGHAAVVELLAARRASPGAQSDVLRPLKRRGLGFAPANRQGGEDAPIKGGITALLFAAREGSMDCVDALVKAGANVNQTSADGSSPLLVAVQNGFYGIGRYLMDHGADINLANSKGWTPLYLAVKNRNQETTAIPGPNTDGVFDFIKALLDHGANPNLRITADTEIHQGMTAAWLKEAGATPLLRAALCGDLPVVRLLLANKADPNIPTLDHTTPLMVASGVGWADGMLREYSEDQTFEVVKLLIGLGSDVNAANDHGITALHGAGFKGANKVVQLLVDHGARLDALDKGEDYGFGVSTVRMTPLNWAEGVPIGMSSPIYHAETVALMARLMKERGIPIVYNSFKGQKPPTYGFPDPASAK
ncbi:MAG TPA: ankyrin repeat domain-containing protein [Bryobacteraceae bacterium]|nr:ankyrin repeat domain-containing protein [Bryobacteraceae bacterium]